MSSSQEDLVKIAGKKIYIRCMDQLKLRDDYTERTISLRDLKFWWIQMKIKFCWTIKIILLEL